MKKKERKKKKYVVVRMGYASVSPRTIGSTTVLWEVRTAEAPLSSENSHPNPSQSEKYSRLG